MAARYLGAWSSPSNAKFRASMGLTDSPVRQQVDDGRLERKPQE